MNLAELQKEYDIASDKYDEDYNNIPLGMEHKEFNEYMTKISKKINDFGRKIRLIKEPTFSPHSRLWQGYAIR